MITQHARTHTILPEDTLREFAEIPAAVASDALNRSGTLAGAINPLRSEMRICGQARTVECPAGDNAPIRAAVRDASAGDVIVCDAKAYEDRAVFGGLMALFAKEKKINGLIIDGAVMFINSGFDKVRFLSPVKVGSNIRALTRVIELSLIHI